ncbi:MAG: serine protease [Pirellulaceae bacterium]|nr:serine protease [Pirellulaceae bacterium]
MRGQVLQGLMSTAIVVAAASSLIAQSVCLPAPRLLTTMPMGGTVGSQVEIKISGENIEDADELYFSDARLKATRKLDAAGKPEANKYVVSIAADCPTGIYEARVMTRLGISSSRVFSVDTLPEVVQKSPNTTVATAMDLPVNSICNGVITAKSVDHYRFTAKRGSRYIINCAAKAIDSKLDAVLILADSNGQDLVAERRGGVLDFSAPADDTYMIKIHELTFRGGSEFFYRLSLQEVPTAAPLPLFASTKSVSSFSWPPAGLPDKAALDEVEPNAPAQSQKITLPCDIAASFFPAADVDCYEFAAKKGEVWWVELASERLGLPTDASVLVQRATGEGASQTWTDVAEFADITSPMKPSSNGYAYDGPPYDAGSGDVLGKLEIKEDGLHRLQVTDLFGGTRSDPRNVYRLVIRPAAPDFAVVAWPLHMELRNGDRAAFSKPIALRGGATIAMEVVAVRRDGFDGEIELSMEGLPEGVTAKGIKIAAGKTRGIMLISAAQDTPRAIANVKFVGQASINCETVTRPCRMAELKWPVPDSWSEIPEPRLVSDVPVSVSGFEAAPLTIVAAETKTWEVGANEQLTIPLKHVRRSEFSAATLQLRTFGDGFERVPQFDVNLTDDGSNAVLNVGALKIPPGNYTIAFYGGAVAKYRYCPEAIPIAEALQRQAEKESQAVTEELKKLETEAANSTAAETKAALDANIAALKAKQQATAASLAAATEQVKQATQRAQPRDIVDIVVSEPIAIHVKPAETK